MNFISASRFTSRARKKLEEAAPKSRVRVVNDK